jgi:hypothetical protein
VPSSVVSERFSEELLFCHAQLVLGKAEAALPVRLGGGALPSQQHVYAKAAASRGGSLLLVKAHEVGDEAGHTATWCLRWGLEEAR